MTVQHENKDINGLWYLTWDDPNLIPTALTNDTNVVIYFTGFCDIPNIISWANKTNTTLGTNYSNAERAIGVGGGTDPGYWHATDVQELTNAITNGTFSFYKWIVYDIEEGEKGLLTLFTDSFTQANKVGLKVIVTISHSAPSWGFEDYELLMNSFLQDPHINIISPQLYTSGTEKSNDYTESPVDNPFTWNRYNNSVAHIVPSIVHNSMYSDAVSHFDQFNVKLNGYIQWSQYSNIQDPSTPISKCIEQYTSEYSLSCAESYCNQFYNDTSNPNCFPDSAQVVPTNTCTKMQDCFMNQMQECASTHTYDSTKCPIPTVSCWSNENCISGNGGTCLSECRIHKELKPLCENICMCEQNRYSAPCCNQVGDGYNYDPICQFYNCDINCD